MKIVAIASSLQDYEAGCLNTLRKFLNEGHTINLIIPKDKNQNRKKISKVNNFYNKHCISNIYIVENFNYSKVTQENVNLINPIIEKINPSLVIIPFINSSNKIKKILAKSSLLACRKVESILMYETTKNKHFSPTVYSTINEIKKQNKTLSNNYETSISNKSMTRKVRSIQKMYAENMGILEPCEVFESHRMVLLQNDLF